VKNIKQEDITKLRKTILELILELARQLT